ncbi:MAG: NAD(P)H-dependent glycerol-3-phosphate dehydrogenase [Alphaproteobacteria bacterium]
MGRIAIIGGGAWGTALACVARRAGHEAVLWAREPEVVEAVNAGRGNPIFLPDIPLDPGIRATGDAAACVEGADAVLMVVPTQFTRAVAEVLGPALPGGTPVALCAKGIERGTGAMVPEIAAECLPGAPLAVLSGPTFAAEVARDMPTAVTMACADAAMGRRLVDAIGTRRFRPYLSDDPVGAAIGGAVKNVLAIACGIVTGRRLGDNARAALITRGLAEMARLGRAKGARPETLMGLSGLGDLTLTCSSPQSRNMSLGIALGQGRTLAEIVGERRSIAEGVDSAASVTALAARLGVDMPICQAVDRIVNGGESIETVIEELLARPFRAEGLGG